MKKNTYVLLLAMFLVMVITAGCSSSPAAADKQAEKGSAAVEKESPVAKEEPVAQEKPAAFSYKDGTYESSSDAGIHPGLKVSVVVKEGKIAEVKVVEHQETDGIGTVAIEKLPSLIIEAQSTEVDLVTGASLSSGAIKEAVNKALEQAK
ncbi:FMN-binding domain protein [Desulfitobacterium hafniense DP7]|uniref:FMN-binding domain protein n=1 Tax=Desulfitobacterium hafniense DP7 TaxID=537010 RepID=G9XS66_DESHA|nr:FMN-binding protein [Desulfitobacterium hafniense]EHL05465.1 FMN-binding domain protein [Desulfitobacterium hafniense DP7]